MQELVGRLTALDPEASESLKVIAYFDALVEGNASLEVLLRGASVLSGCAAGFTTGSTGMAVDAAGRLLAGPVTAPTPGTSTPTHALPAGGLVWIAREGPAHANDAMVLERLAIGLAISLDRRAERMRDPAAHERRALQVLLDPEETTDARTAAVHRLRLASVPLARIAVSPSGSRSDDARGVVIATSVGRVRARILLPDETAPTHETTRDAAALPTGIGIATPPLNLASSWRTALLALRMTAPREPMLRADDLGVVLLAAEAADAASAGAGAASSTSAHPDVAAIAAAVAADSRGTDALDLLDALARTESVRAAAALAGVHHSTMQSRAADLAATLGFDPRTPAGRVRLSGALRLHRLATARFDGSGA